MLNVSQHSQENTFTRVSFLINIVAADNLSRHKRKVGAGTHTWDPEPGTFHLGTLTRNSGTKAEARTRDVYVGPKIWDPPPGTGDPNFGNRNPIPLREIRDPT